ncbi:DUF3572 domain-containing protein [Lentibacter sp.]|uniref:DUF3572 domain-containing protein n=1 Tax=Lentibacter sp. TaxID=2024994 RepID=UPI003F6A962D
MSISQEMAEDIGIKALIWLAGNEDLLPVFLGASGALAGDIKAQAGEPAFLASVLDFLLMDDAWVMGFCDAEGLKYDLPMRARAALPGGEQVNWT